MATLYKTDGTTEELTPANGKAFTLRELQDAVGGYIELGYSHDGQPMFFNEEGKLKMLPENYNATELFRYGQHRGFALVGPVLLCSNVEAGGPPEKILEGSVAVDENQTGKPS